MGSHWWVLMESTAPVTMHASQLFVTFLMVACLTSVCLSTCEYRNGGEINEIEEGSVTEVRKTTVRVCENGKTILKKKEEVPKPFKRPCGGCFFDGKIVCNGIIVRDLYRWWFKAQCQNGLMRPIGRTYLDVASDPRFRAKP